MSFDFPTLLVIAVFASGAIWLLDAWIWAPKRAASGEGVLGGRISPAKEPVLVEYARSFFPIFLIVLLIRSFLIEPFRIPSGSMLPTLWVGDFIVVNKFIYGLRLPTTNTKIVPISAPKRGDIVVFHHPLERVDYIKRIIGVPGDKVVYENKRLTVNGEPVKYQALPERFVASGQASEVYEEELNETKHKILINPDWLQEGRGVWIVPPGQYFVMGDNRDNSNDSRVWGMVPEDHLLGKAFAVWLSWDFEKAGFFNLNWSRMFQSIYQ